MAEVKQNMHNQKHEKKSMKLEYHRDVQRESHFGELRMKTVDGVDSGEGGFSQKTFRK